MNLGSRLKQILEERGLTVTQFSKEAGVPAQTLYALINRDSNKADMDILIKILTALGMDFFAFMGAEAPAGAASDTSAAATAASSTSAPTANVPEHVVKKIVEKVVVKEVPAAAPEGKHVLYINSNTYDKITALAAEEGITDETVLSQVIEEYMELGFGYRQRPLRSILRDFKPKSGRSGEMDSFLL
ncbi:MAG: helix-turn-helix transcriptional regulator [bacterium]|nr:helix-turn-helix transcriptional regulator [bacterium]MDY4099772.1 helix-turn-helix transcriptional regulator [Lachnospiraceae bacterium]